MRLPEPGQVFESYRVGELLGSGGFARVYAATSLGIEQSVALKILMPAEHGGYDTQLVQRFMREARSVAQLQDPHTLRLFNFGRSTGGLLFMTFERLPGQDLDGLLKSRGRLTEPEVVHITKQLLSSLREAHEHGLLHRDVKPRNIRVYPYLDDLFVKVMDFGIAKSIIEPDTPLTRTGDIVGTPRYMAPEQLMDDALTPAVDVYSTGLVAFDMLFGLDARGAALSGVQVDDDAGVSPLLRGILNQALAADPDRRFEDAGQMLAAFDEPAPQPQKTQKLAPAARVSTSQKPSRRWSILIIAAAMLCLLAVAIIGHRVRAGRDDPAPHTATSATRAPRLNPLVNTAEPEPAPPAPVEPHTAQTPVDVGVESLTEVAPCTGGDYQRGHSDLRIIDGLDESRWPVYVPQNYEPLTRHPLVVLLHDQMMKSGEFIHYERLVELAEAEGFILFAPEDEKFNTWSGDEVDADYIALGVADVMSKLCIDPERIYGIGQGRGAFMVELLSCQVNFAAIATSNQTRKPMSVVPCDQPVPNIYLHGMRSPFHPPDGSLSCSGEEGETLARRDAERRRLRDCSTEAVVVLQSGDSKCVSWNCEPPFVSCRLDGGHNWPLFEERVMDTMACESTPADFPYAATIWRFFDGELD